MGLLRIQGKVVKESGKKVKTRHVSINSIKTRGEELKSCQAVQGVNAHPRRSSRGNAGEGTLLPCKEN